MLDRPALAARIQEILRSRPKPAGGIVEGGALPSGGDGPRLSETDEGAAFARRCEADAAERVAVEALGGELRHGEAGTCLVVEHRYDADRAHGRRSVSSYAAALARGGAGLDLLLAQAGGETGGEAGTPLFFDLETTGLSGGAGTYAFLVGCGWFEGEAFQTRQFFLRGYAHERALLHAVTAFVRDFNGTRDSGDPRDSLDPRDSRDPLTTDHCPLATVVTYNGRAFDLPVMETRYQMHRLASPFAAARHLDLLFPARRLWRRRAARAGSDRRTALLGERPRPDDRASCALTVLEEDILGIVREGDVPGWEIPGRYFAYTRTGDAGALEAVLEHNRLDLVSLGALTALVLEMLGGRREAGDRWEMLALARLFDYLGQPAEAERCYRCAAAPDGLFEAALDTPARAEALRWLALRSRRGRRFAEAAEAWRQLLDLPALDPALRREALEALAVHHEHRARDLVAARRFALRALDIARRGRSQEELAHRVDRLARKLAAAAGPAAADPAARSQAAADLLNSPASRAR